MSRGKAGGFTLVEMMVALLVLAVLIVISAPGFSNLIKNNRMLSHMYAMRAALNGARSEALAQRNIVTLCRSADGAKCCHNPPADPACSAGDWNTGFIAFLDDNGNSADRGNSAVDPNDQIFISKVLDVDTLEVKKIDTDWPDFVQFDSRGYATNSSQGTFRVCDDRGDDYMRGIEVTLGGMVVALDPNDPSIDFDCRTAP